MKEDKLRRMVLFSFAIVTVISMAFTGVLHISSFQQNYTESLISSYSVAGGESVRKIEYAVSYGKPLENFYDIESVLGEVLDDFPDIIEVQVVSQDNEILYNQEGRLESQFLPESLHKLASFPSEDQENYRYTREEGLYNLFLPINDRDGQWVGSLNIVFPQAVITEPTNHYTMLLLRYLGIMALAGFLLLAFVSRVISYRSSSGQDTGDMDDGLSFDTSLISFITPSGEINRKMIMIIMILMLGSIQVAFGWINYNMFKDAYQANARNNITLVAGIIQKNIESVIEKGVSYDQLYRLDDYLEGIVETVPEMERIYLASDKGEVLYYTDPGSDKNGLLSQENETSGESADQKDPFLLYDRSLAEDVGQNSAQLHVELSQSFFDNRMRNILLDTGTMVVVSFVLMIEAILFLIIILKKQFSSKVTTDARLKTPARYKPLDMGIVRPLMFLLGSAVFMASAFIPLMMQQLYQPLWGLSKSVVLGLPISAEMLFAAVFAVVAGSLVDKQDWRYVFTLGTIIFAAGLFFSYQAFHPLFFIMARAIAGAGYGTILIALRGFVNSRPLEADRTEGFSAFVSGLYAGFIAGVVVGAMLADRIGYAQVFLVSLVFCLLTGLFAFIFLREEETTGENRRKGFHPGSILNMMFRKQETDSSQERFLEDSEKIKAKPQPEEAPAASGGLFNFLSNIPVLGLFLFIVLPLTICSMFVDYFLPVFAASEGVSTSNVGRAFMLNGIAIVYLGPFLSNYTGKKWGPERSILVSGLIIVLAIGFFLISRSFEAAFLAAILLGVSESFGLVAQNNYFVNLRATGIIGTGAALGYFDNVRKLGQMLGPIVFGSVLAFGYSGISIIALLTLVALFLFLFTARSARAA